MFVCSRRRGSRKTMSQMFWRQLSQLIPFNFHSFELSRSAVLATSQITRGPSGKARWASLPLTIAVITLIHFACHTIFCNFRFITDDNWIGAPGNSPKLPVHRWHWFDKIFYFLWLNNKKKLFRFVAVVVSYRIISTNKRHVVTIRFTLNCCPFSHFYSIR